MLNSSGPFYESFLYLDYLVFRAMCCNRVFFSKISIRNNIFRKVQKLAGYKGVIFQDIPTATRQGCWLDRSHQISKHLNFEFLPGFSKILPEKAEVLKSLAHIRKYDKTFSLLSSYRYLFSTKLQRC